jgi:hypothetical protein
VARGTSPSFFEALSLGRIPLLIDTGCALPFESAIDWRKHCVIVPEADLPRAGERVRAFHDAMTEADFRDLQRANRRLWDDWVSPLAAHTRCVREVLDKA